MNKILDIKYSPAKIDINFETAKAQILKDLEPYKIVVTEDTVKGAKKLAADINVMKKDLDDAMKEAIRKVSLPIQEADQQRKDLIQIYTDGYADLKAQINKYDDKKRDEAKEKLRITRDEEWESEGIEQEFRKAEYEDLATVTALTVKGNLTASVYGKLRDRIRADKQIQDQTERRLLQLKVQSLEAGLKAPLTRDHVNSFLFQDESAYQSELDRIIASEIQRQEIADKATRAEVAREQQRQAEAQPPAAEQTAESEQQALSFEQEEVAADEEESVQQVSNSQATQLPHGFALCTVACTFQIQIPAKMPTDLIEKQIKERMAQAGFRTLQSVVAKIHQQSNAA